MRTLLTAFSLVLLLGLGDPGDAWAQRTSGSGNQGMFGNRSLGGNITPGNRSFGGTNALSGAGFTGSAFGGGSAVGGQGTAGGMSGGMLGANERFVRGNRQPGQFVGSDAQDLANVFGGLAGAGANSSVNQQSRSGLNPQAMNRGGQNNRANQPNRAQGGRGARGGRSAAEIRITVSPGFRYLRPAGPEIRSALSERMEKSSRIAKLAPITVALQGETVVLQGAVETEHDRALAEQLALLEPGVRQVKNELIVGPPAGLGQPAPQD